MDSTEFNKELAEQRKNQDKLWEDLLKYGNLLKEAMHAIDTGDGITVALEVRKSIKKEIKDLVTPSALKRG